MAGTSVVHKNPKIQGGVPDQGIEFQQSLSRSDLGVVVVRARSNRIEHLLPLVSAMLGAIARVQRGEVVRIGG